MRSARSSTAPKPFWISPGETTNAGMINTKNTIPPVAQKLV